MIRRKGRSRARGGVHRRRRRGSLPQGEVKGRGGARNADRDGLPLLLSNNNANKATPSFSTPTPMSLSMWAPSAALRKTTGMVMPCASGPGRSHDDKVVRDGADLTRPRHGVRRGCRQGTERPGVPALPARAPRRSAAAPCIPCIGEREVGRLGRGDRPAPDAAVDVTGRGDGDGGH